MPFLRPLSDTAPKRDPALPWPIHGLAYDSAFMGPVSAGPLIGALAHEWLAALVGLVMGVGVMLLGAWLSDRFVDPWVGAHQRPLQKVVPRLLVNIAVIAWAAALTALTMLAPLTVFGSEILMWISMTACYLTSGDDNAGTYKRATPKLIRIVSAVSQFKRTILSGRRDSTQPMD